MSRQIEFEHLNLSKWIPDEELKNFKSTVEHARNTLVKRDGAGNDFTGWLNHPVAYDKEEFERILQAAEEIRQNSDVLLVVGIGGSYLGARAAIEFLTVCRMKNEKHPAFIFAETRIPQNIWQTWRICWKDATSLSM